MFKLKGKKKIIIIHLNILLILDLCPHEVLFSITFHFLFILIKKTIFCYTVVCFDMLKRTKSKIGFTYLIKKLPTSLLKCLF